jgi:hypothetical protein
MLSILAVILLVAVAAQAAEVKSANVAGVINVEVQAGEYKLVGMKLDKLETVNPTIGDILGTEGVPDNTTVYLYDGATYQGHTYYEGAGWYDDVGESTTVVDRVVGFWIVSPVTHTFSLTGEAPDYDTPVSLDPGYQIVNYPFPAEVALQDSQIGQNAADNDTIYVLEGGDYVGHTYYEGAGWYDDVGESTLTFSYGDSFWYSRAGGATSFDETVPYTL